MLVVVAIVLLAATDASASPPISGTREHPCKVGGPPAWYFWRIPPGVKKLSPILTIACGRRLVGQPYEVVAVDTSQGLWVYADSGRLGFSEGLSFSPEAPLRSVYVQRGWSSPPSRTRLSGVIGADVARVEVIFHHRGQSKRVVRTPTTALVNGELLRKLHQNEPLGAYALTINGCVPPKGIRAIAFDAQGLRIESARVFSSISHACNPASWFQNP